MPSTVTYACGCVDESGSAGRECAFHGERALDVSISAKAPEKVREGDQPLPSSGSGPAIQDLVQQDIEARKAVGIRRYGTLLHAHDGRDNLRDLYEEIMDALIYIRKELYQRDGR